MLLAEPTVPSYRLLLEMPGGTWTSSRARRGIGLQNTAFVGEPIHRSQGSNRAREEGPAQPGQRRMCSRPRQRLSLSLRVLVSGDSCEDDTKQIVEERPQKKSPSPHLVMALPP